jgi:hypothetical protein
MTTTISTGLPAPALPRPYSLLEHQRAARRHETSRRRLKLPGCFCSRSESLPTFSLQAAPGVPAVCAS